MTWNGALAAGASATITIEVEIAAGVPLGTTIANQATLAFDTDNDGSNDGAGLSDDPSLPGAPDPAAFVGAPESVVEIPALGRRGLAALALLLAAAAGMALRRGWA